MDFHQKTTKPIASMYGIFTYIYHILDTIKNDQM